MNQTLARPPASRIAAWLLTAAALLAIMYLELLGALLAGLLVFQLVHMLAPLLHRRLPVGIGRWIAVALLATAIVGLLTLAIFGLIAFFRSEAGSVPALLDRMMQIIDQARASLPATIAQNLPRDTEDARQAIADWIVANSNWLQLAGRETLVALVHILVGMVLGALVALNEVLPEHRIGPLALELYERASRVSGAFRRVVFAQIRISAVNTILTGIFLAVVLPLAGVNLPLTKTLIVITFVAGLLPVIGNLISNTIITVIGLSVSLYVALVALVYLIIIHKLEYFLNARIVGTQIRARAWEILLAMLLMEAAFGLPGLIAAPIYYAYVKSELVDQGWL